MHYRDTVKRARSLLMEAGDLLISALEYERKERIEDYVALAVLRLIKVLHMLTED